MPVARGPGVAACIGASVRGTKSREANMVSIKVQEATVRTAAVEIKALTVNGKQVTMGLFRQLKNEPLVDIETGLLRGVPWGTVNYFFGSCSADHSHIVWQSGDELRRSCELWTHPAVWPPRLQTKLTSGMTALPRMFMLTYGGYGSTVTKRSCCRYSMRTWWPSIRPRIMSHGACLHSGP